MATQNLILNLRYKHVYIKNHFSIIQYNKSKYIFFYNKLVSKLICTSLSFPHTASCDVGFAIYFRYAVESTSAPSVSYVAHLTGALAGLTIGLLVLKNFEQKLHEQMMWWIALGVYAACTIFAIVYNVMNTVTAQRLEESEEVLRQQLFHDLGI